MRIRGLLVAAILLALLGGAIWWSNKAAKDSAAAPSSDLPKILDLAEDDIRRIEMRRDFDETTVVERDDSGAWKLTAPAAFRVDQDAMSSLVRSLAKLEADKLVEEKVEDFGPFGLKEPSFYALVTTKDGKLHTVLLGDETPTGAGHFARLAGDARLFTIASYTKTGIDKKAADLRDKRLLTFDQDKLARVELAAKGAATEFGKNNENEWQIIKPQPLRADGWAVDELVRRLRDAKLDPSMSEEDAKKNAAAFSSASLVAVATVTDAQGSQKLEVRKTRDNRYLARSSAVDGVHVLASDAGEALIKDTSDFRNKKLFDFGFTDPTRVEYKDSQRARAFSKAGERWLESNKPMDSVGVQSLIDRLRDLSATTFPASAFTTPEIEMTVMSGEGGKRTEKVAISQAGDKYIARRDGEPSLYGIEASVIDELRKAAEDVKEAQPPESEKKK